MNAVRLDTWACRMKSIMELKAGGPVESALDQRGWRFAMLAVVECKILVQKSRAHDPFKESDFVDSRNKGGTYSRAGRAGRQRRVLWPLARFGEPRRDPPLEVGDDIHRGVSPQGRMS
jgi:hypothetical protein